MKQVITTLVIIILLVFSVWYFMGEQENQNVMKLDMHTWKWIKTTYNNDTELVPHDPEAFTLTFNDDSSFSASTDCNSIGGSYSVDGNQFAFGEDMFMTEMFCENSQEQDFVAMLQAITSFFFTTEGELVLELKYDTGSAIFR